MNKINNNTVTVSTSNELKKVLEEDNTYEYIYLENDITLDAGITINKNKTKVIIDGTYQNITHTLTGMNSTQNTDTIIIDKSPKEIQIKNINIVSTNTYGILYTKLEVSNRETINIFDNITFKGTKLALNSYGTVKITNSNITIEETNSVDPQEVCEASYIIIGGKTNITSSSIYYSLFTFKEDNISPYIIFLCKSDVIISTDSRELMSGTNELNLTILHDTKVHLTTANGFAPNPNEGANNVLIEERASLIFIEKSHQRIPMWAIYGTLTMKEDSELQVINSYNNTPSDNYNIHFKGSNCRLNLYNPKNLTIYTKNSNVIYTDNLLNFTIECSRINMWPNATDLSSAGDINNIPTYSWYKDNAPLKIEGLITSSLTSITSYNITKEELQKLPDIGNFTFQNKKQFSIGTTPMNIHPINNTKNTISGHTAPFADILIKYNSTSEIVNADDEGLFEYNLTSPVADNTTIELTTNVAGSFIYGTRKVTTPTIGELTLLEVNPSFNFSNIPITNTLIFPKAEPLTTIIVDSRQNSSDWKLYAYLNNPLTSTSGYILNNALVFKKFDDEIIVLTTTPKLVYTGKNNEGITSYNKLNWSTEKGPLLDLTSEALEINEEYFSKVNFVLEE